MAVAALGFDRPHEQRVDASLSTLLVVQCLVFFVAIPLSAAHPVGLVLLDACHFTFAVVCVAILTRHRVVQGALLAGPTLLVVARLVDGRLSGRLGVEATTLTELIAFNAFAFNGNSSRRRSWRALSPSISRMKALAWARRRRARHWTAPAAGRKRRGLRRARAGRGSRLPIQARR